MLIGAPHNHAPCSQAWDKWLSIVLFRLREITQKTARMLFAES